jgi:membrane fusion protein (multidrug efflux system)
MGTRSSPDQQIGLLNLPVLGTSLFLLLILGGCEGPKTQGGPAPQAIPEVGVVEIKPRDVTLSTELPGRTAPYLVAEVRPQVSGIIQERLFTEGGAIEAGQLLYQIDPAPHQAARDSAQAALARDQASLETAQLKATRYQKLLKTRAVSQEDYDDATAALAEAKAVVAVSQAALRAAEINLAYTRVTSPISGRIGRSSVTAGALVTANQADALAQVNQLDPIYVDLTQSSLQLLKLKRALASGEVQRAEGEEPSVELILEDGSRFAHKGRLQFSEVTVSQSTGTVTLRAVVPNPEGDLLPGMYVRALVQEGVKPQAILAPQRGVEHDAKGEATALVLGKDDTVEQRLLKVDRSLGNQWLITSGLEAGDRLIVDGLQKVRPGAKARAVTLDVASDDGAIARN